MLTFFLIGYIKLKNDTVSFKRKEDRVELNKTIKDYNCLEFSNFYKYLT